MTIINQFDIIILINYYWGDFLIGNINLSLKSQLIGIFVIGILLGNVFVFGELHWNATVSREECISKVANYESYDIDYNSKSVSISQMILHFTDYEQQTFDGVSVTDELVDTIENLPIDSKVSMLIHPNSDTILEMTISGEKLIEFDDTMSKIVRERNGFVVLGSILYIFAFTAGIKLITMQKKK